MSSQFADLFEKVDGTNSYSVLVDIITGERPTPLRRKGRYRIAASCVLRTFHDPYVKSVPGDSELERLEHECPDIRVEVLCTPGTLPAAVVFRIRRPPACTVPSAIALGLAGICFAKGTQ